MQAVITYQASQGQIRRFAKRVLMRARAAALASLQLDDIEQELAIAWCRARDSWDASLGVPFAAYLHRGMCNHINRFLERQCEEKYLAPASLDFEMDDEGNDNHEITADPNHVSPDDTIAERQTMEWFIDSLSPRARQFVELLHDTPPELVEVMQALEAKLAYAKSRGINKMGQSTTLPRMILEFMGCNRVEGQKIKSEVRRLAAEFSKK